jgi:GH35 family endo-1,4-beta-xylanase
MRCVVIPLSFCVLVFGALALRGANTDDHETLRQYADKIGFHIGTLYERKGAATEPDYNSTVAREYNSLISTTFWKAMQPDQGKFDFQALDLDMDFAR